MKFAPLHWMDLVAGGTTVPVYLSCAALSTELKDCVGVTLGDVHPETILIDVAPDRAEQDITLAHEFLHSCLWFKNGLHWQTEERIVQAISVAGRSVWKWRRRPAGVRALEAFARRV